MGKKFVKWTPEDDAKLSKLMRNAGIVHGSAIGHWHDIAAHFEHRSWIACRQHWLLLRRIASGKLPVPHSRKQMGRIQRTRKEILDDVRRQQSIPPQPLYVPLSHAVAIILGDPAPGRSALDKIRAGEVDPPPLMNYGRGVRAAARNVTLAQGPGR